MAEKMYTLAEAARELGVVVEKRAFTYAKAAAAYDVSIDVIRRAADRGEIERRYPSTKPVISVEALDEWWEALPKDRPTFRSR